VYIYAASPSTNSSPTTSLLLASDPRRHLASQDRDGEGFWVRDYGGGVRVGLFAALLAHAELAP
jgi:hypothetical protein